jgi:hypothetical protein
LRGEIKMEKLIKAYSEIARPMPQWLINSLRTGFQMKDKAIIIECHKMWNKVLEERKW